MFVRPTEESTCWRHFPMIRWTVANTFSSPVFMTLIFTSHPIHNTFSLTASYCFFFFFYSHATSKPHSLSLIQISASVLDLLVCARVKMHKVCVCVCVQVNSDLFLRLTGEYFHCNLTLEYYIYYIFTQTLWWVRSENSLRTVFFTFVWSWKDVFKSSCQDSGTSRTIHPLAEDCYIKMLYVSDSQ